MTGGQGSGRTCPNPQQPSARTQPALPFAVPHSLKTPKDVPLLGSKEPTLPSVSKIVSLGLNETITWQAEVHK